MTYPLAGLWHSRGGPLASGVVATAIMLAVVFPELGLPVRNVIEHPARGVGTPEIVAVLLSSVLPVITIPRFDAKELQAQRRTRLVHLTYTAAVLAAPLVILPLWYLTVMIEHPHAMLPPMSGLVGNLALFSCLATVLSLTFGGLVSSLLTPILFAIFVVLQQAFPGSVLATEFATGKDWHTNWWITGTAVLLTLTVSWRLRAVPMTAR